MWALKRRRGRCLIPRIVSHRLPHQGVPSPLSRAFTPPLPVVGGAPFTPSCPKRLAALGVGLGPITACCRSPRHRPTAGQPKKKKKAPHPVFVCGCFSMAPNVLRTLRCQLGSYRVAYCIVLRIVRGAAPRPARGDRSDPAIVIFFFFFFLFVYF